MHITLQRALRRPQVPAWLFSLVLHAVVLLLLGIVSLHLPQGASPVPYLEVGIALRSDLSAGEMFDGEDGQSDRSGAESAPPSTDVFALLPNPTEASRATSVLPALPASAAPSTGAGNALASASNLAEAGGRLRGGRAGSGGEATTSVFGVEGSGHKFVYVFDRSTSMEGAPLAAAKRELLESIAVLEATHQFHIVFFSTTPVTFDLTGQKRIAFATDTNKQRAAAFVRDVTADGGTDREAALLLALGYAPDVIFFLTDADDAMSAAEIQKVLDRNQRAGCYICTIQFGRGPDHGEYNFLRQLAKATGGQYGYVDAQRLAP